jgi:hypothetical protein
MSQPRGISIDAWSACARSPTKVSRGTGTIASCGAIPTENPPFARKGSPHAIAASPNDSTVSHFYASTSANNGFHTFGQAIPYFRPGTDSRSGAAITRNAGLRMTGSSRFCHEALRARGQTLRTALPSPVPVDPTRNVLTRREERVLFEPQTIDQTAVRYANVVIRDCMVDRHVGNQDTTFGHAHR